MKKAEKPVKSGLQQKILVFSVAMVIIAIAAFAFVGIMEIVFAGKKTGQTSRETSEIIKEKSKDSMMKITRENLVQTVSLAARITDVEFWVMEHDFYVLCAQVEDVFLNPELYEEVEVYQPQKENEGIYTLQVMYAEESAKTDENTQYMIKRLANLEPMMTEIVAGNGEFSMDCYIALADGTVLMMDQFSGGKFNDDGSLKSYDIREIDWFRDAMKLDRDQVLFTSAVRSDFYDVNEVIFAVPVVVNGKNVAGLQVSIELETIRYTVSEMGYGEEGFSIILDEDGLVYSPRTEGELAMENELSTPIKGRVNKDLEKMLTEDIWNKTGFQMVEVDNKTYYAAYAPVSTVYWMQVMFVPEEQVEKPTNELLSYLSNVSEETLNEYTSVFSKTVINTIITLVFLIIGAVITSLIFSSRIAKPIKIMTSNVKDISGDNLIFEKKEIYKTGDEIEILADAFKEMSERTRNYIDELMHITSEKERMATELSVAAQIQTDMLPKNFPLFPERNEFDVYASMSPAKEVGGDFYDIFMIDDDHLGLVMGDVSGKGVSAALFMVKSKTLIQNRAMMGGTPGEILADVNNKLFEGNTARMFVTVWLGILTISSGHVIEANAGHMNPAIKKNGKNYELIVKKHGTVLGLREGKTYIDDEFTLDSGEILYIYTDGVSEAEDTGNNQFGTERMLEALNNLENESPKETLDAMSECLERFADGAIQSDDITMLAIKYIGRQL
jgi:sigma-B regulation protein RsbU (phosphoserine phosphatase)